MGAGKILQRCCWNYLHLVFLVKRIRWSFEFKYFFWDIFPVGWSHPRFDFLQSFGLGDIRKPLPQEDETWTTSSDRRKIQSSPSEKVVLLYDMNFGGLLSYLFMYLCIYFIHISLVSCFMCFVFYFKHDNLIHHGCVFFPLLDPQSFTFRVASSRLWVPFAWIFSRLATQKNDRFKRPAVKIICSYHTYTGVYFFFRDIITQNLHLWCIDVRIYI